MLNNRKERIVSKEEAATFGAILFEKGARLMTEGVYRLGRFDFYPRKSNARDFRTNEFFTQEEALELVGNLSDLTKQWLEGELPRDNYWVEYRNGKIDQWETGGNGIPVGTSPKIVAILDRVPSYDEWYKLKEFADYSIHNRDELTRQINFLLEENKKLMNIVKIVKHQCEILMPKNGLSPITDRDRLCSAFLHAINREGVLKND